MKKIFEKLILIIYPNYQAHKAVLNRLVRNKNSYLHTTGWLESRKRGYPCNRDGDEIPWMNFPIISFLEERLNSDMNLFEYGTGYSTLFYARHVKSVTSVEYNKEWHDLIKQRIPDNVQIIYKINDTDGEYCRTINSTKNHYNVVIIDGRDRVNCIMQSIPNLTEDGVILLDDSSRDKYKKGIDHAVENGFRALNFEGLKPTGNGAAHKTTILYRNNNCLNI